MNREKLRHQDPRGLATQVMDAPSHHLPWADRPFTTFDQKPLKPMRAEFSDTDHSSLAQILSPTELTQASVQPYLQRFYETVEKHGVRLTVISHASDIQISHHLEITER